MSKRNRRRQRQRANVERRANSYGPVPMNDSHTLFGNYPMTSTGIRVDNYSADCNYVFRRGVEVIAQSLAKICRKWRIQCEGSDGATTDYRGVHYRLMTRAANQYTTAFSFWELLESWAKAWGNGYAWILRSNDMTPVGLYPLHPSRVIPRLARNSDSSQPWPWSLYYQIDGGREIFLPYEILHIKGNPGFDGVTGYNLVQLHENTLAIAQAQNEYSGEFFQNGAVAGGFLELPAHLKSDVVLKYQKDFQDRYSSRGNRHKIGIVDTGVKFTSTTLSPEASQLLEARKFSIFEIAMLLGVPPTVLGDLSHGTFSNTEQQQLALNMLTIHPIAECWRQELDVKMTPPAVDDDEEYTWEYDTALRALDAADTSARMAYLHTAVGGPWMSKEEAREEDGLPQEINGTIYPPPNMTAPTDGDKPAEAAEDKPADDTKPLAEGRAAIVPATVETRSLSSRDKSTGALEPVFRDTAQRIATKEAKAISGLTKHIREGHPEVFEKRAGEFYDRHAEHVAESFTPALRSLCTQVRSDVAEERDGDMAVSDDAAAGAYAKAMAGRHVEQSKAAIAEMMTGEKDPSKVADAIDARCHHWQEHRAGTVGYEMRQAGNYFAREAYRAAGCTSLRWVANPADGEECRAMDGRTVGIDEQFAEGKHHPPLADGCMCGIVGMD